MENKRSLSTLLFAAAILVFVCATFAMFGRIAINIEGGVQNVPNMFQVAFSGFGTDARVPGMTAVLVFQIIILTCIVAIIYGAVTNKFHYILMIVLYGIVCLCSFIALIISFNAKGLFFGINRTDSGAFTLGPGPIAYSVMHIIGLTISAAGLFLSRKS